MNAQSLRWRACSSPGVVRPCCCAAVDGSLHHASTQTACKHHGRLQMRKKTSSHPHRTQQCPQVPATATEEPQLACNSASNSHQSAEQQLWLPQQHKQILLQMQYPAQQVHHELEAQQGLQAVQLHRATDVAGLACSGCSFTQHVECHSTNYPTNNVDSSCSSAFSRPAWRGCYIIAAAGASNQDSSSGSSHTSNSGNSDSLKSIRERMRQRVTSRVTQSSQHAQAAAAAAAAGRAAAQPAAAPTSKRLPPILPAATNESSISDVLQQLQQKLSNTSKLGTQSKGTLNTSSNSSSSSPSSGENSTPRQANAVLLGRNRRQQDQQPGISTKEQEQQTREFMAQQRLQLLHQEQQQRKRQQLMQKAQIKEQRAAAFKQLQASADIALKQHAGRTRTANQRSGLTEASSSGSSSSKSSSKSSSSSTSSKSSSSTSSKSSSSTSSKSSKVLKPAKARAYTQQLASRRRTTRRKAADAASTVAAATAAADTQAPAKSVLRRRIAAAAAAPQQGPARTAAASAASSSKVAAKPKLQQLATELGLEVELLRGLVAIVAKTEAPYVVQQQLLADYAAGKPGIPRNPAFLARRLMHFNRAADLLGGPDRACNIIERDTSLLLMAPALLQRKLQNLQQLLAGTGIAEHSAVADTAEKQNGRGSSSCNGPDQSLDHSEGATGSIPAGISSSSSSSAGISTGDAASSSSSTSGTSSFKASAEVLGLVRSHPGLLHLSASGLEQRLAALQRALGLNSIQDVVQVVRWQPRVLSMNEEALHHKVWGMAATIHVPPVAIQSLYTKQPLLLNLSASTLSDKVAALKSTLGLSAQQLWEMLSCKPGVLLFSSTKISRKWAALQQLAGSHPRWRSELAELSPSSLVQLLTASDARLARLHHVVAVGGQDLQALYYTVNQQSEKNFKSKFKTYDAWLAQGRRKQGISVDAGPAAFAAAAAASTRR